MVVAVRKINSCKLPQRTVKCKDYSRYNSTAFCDDLAACNWENVFETDDVNVAWLKWKDIFSNVCDKHVDWKLIGVLIGRHVTTFLIRLKVRNGVFIVKNLTTTSVIQLPFGRQ